MAAEVLPIMSNLPITSTHFEGGQRLTPIDTSEGGAALASLLNAVATPYETATATAVDIDLSAGDAQTTEHLGRALRDLGDATRA